MRRFDSDPRLHLPFRFPIMRGPSLTLGISPAGSRFAHACLRLKFDSDPRLHLPFRFPIMRGPSLTLGISPAGLPLRSRLLTAQVRFRPRASTLVTETADGP